MVDRHLKKAAGILCCIVLLCALAVGAWALEPPACEHQYSITVITEATEDTEACLISGAATLLCEECFARLSSDTDLRRQAQAQKQENLVGGVVGALLGSLIGAAVIVILARLGYVASISGVAMAVCTLKGYEMVSGKLSNRGIILSCALMLGMIYLGNRIDWAITVAQYFEADFFSAFRAVPLLIEEEVIESGRYYTNLAMVYLFAAAGAVPTIITSVKNRGVVNTAGRMQPSQALRASTAEDRAQ